MESIAKLRFVSLKVDKTLESLTLDEVFTLRDGDELELCYRKGVMMLGGSGMGKSKLSRALARRECVRQDQKLFFDGKGNFDGFGMLAKEGFISKFGAVIMNDFQWSFGQRESLSVEDIKAIVRTEETAEFKARYWNGKLMAEVVRIFNRNHMDAVKAGVVVDVGQKFVVEGLAGLAALARNSQAEGDALGDDQIAVARGCIVCIIPDDLPLMMEGEKLDPGRADRAKARRDREAAFVQMKQSAV
jgi:hypothetical protein